MAVLVRIPYNNAELLRIDSSPQGIITALVGSLAVNYNTGLVYKNLDGSTSWELVTTGVGVSPNPQPTGGGGGGNPVGVDGNVQFNDNGSFGADSTFTFNLTSNTLSVPNISGSLTRLTDGSAYITAGTAITVTTSSAGSITISSTASSMAGGNGSNNNIITADGSGGLVAEGNLNFTGNTLEVTGSFSMKGNILPDQDVFYTLGSETKRWAHVYTGDLHLRNERGDYTLIEEEEFLSIRFNKTGKRYKFLLEPVPELDEQVQ